MSVRFYLNPVAASQVVTTRVPASHNTCAHTRHEFDGERVLVRNGEYYFEEYGCSLKTSASAEFMKHIGRVTASYTGARRQPLRESGCYRFGLTTAIVEPYSAGNVKDSYETYEVTLSGPTLDSVNALLLAILDGTLRPERSLHGAQQGIPLSSSMKVVKDLEKVNFELTEQLRRAQMVIDSFSAVYSDYQRVVKEQRAVIESHAM